MISIVYFLILLGLLIFSICFLLVKFNRLEKEIIIMEETIAKCVDSQLLLLSWSQEIDDFRKEMEIYINELNQILRGSIQEDGEGNKGTLN